MRQQTVSGTLEDLKNISLWNNSQSMWSQSEQSSRLARKKSKTEFSIQTDKAGFRSVAETNERLIKVCICQFVPKVYQRIWFYDVEYVLESCPAFADQVEKIMTNTTIGVSFYYILLPFPKTASISNNRLPFAVITMLEIEDQSANSYHLCFKERSSTREW